MTLSRQDLLLCSPWLNAAGSLGLHPPRRWNWPEPPGAFITMPLSPRRRTPAEGRAVLPCAGGFLLHTGLPNPGLGSALRHQAAAWARSAVPVWVHLLPSSPEEAGRMVRLLEGREGVGAVELGIPPLASGAEALALAQAALGELPLVLHLPLTRAGEDWLGELAGLGVSALSLGAPRGALPRKDGKVIEGRLYGPAVFPLALAAVHQARRWGLPVIAGGGVYHKEQGEALRSAGAWAVQLDAVLWQA